MATRVLQYKTPLSFLKNPFPENRLILDLPLKVFGCTTFNHIPNSLTSKLDPRAEKCIFLGYAPNKKGYKCFNPRTKKLHIVMDVVFIEDQFFTKIIFRGEEQ
ncbi:hypothetical protein Patl1_35052 [Pistacia atlantica]|uniref:Uncharacterized protein n=1 Tax=Pistacia atlantica TaxID=434234 RepID=A0ACC0ZST9_9ROSI|nr:hypothetical protein Patl1_35052 [Pistacia atlantica]